jgi:hypothetical protein
MGIAGERENGLQSFLQEARKCDRPVILLEGTRKVPDKDVGRLSALASILSSSLPNAIFRSGNAQGSDSYFFQTLAVESPDLLEYILPYPGSGKKRIPPLAHVFSPEDLQEEENATVIKYTLAVSPDLEGLIQMFLERGRNRVTVKAMYLLRDTMKVMGAPSLHLPPADFGFFFVNPDNPLSGGTGHTMRVCKEMKVPIFTQDDWGKWAI